MAIPADIKLDTGCASQAPFNCHIGGNSNMNGIRSKIWRDRDRKIDMPARPILWK